MHYWFSDLPEVEENEDTNAVMVLIDTDGCDMAELEVPSDVSKGNIGTVSSCLFVPYPAFSTGVVEILDYTD